MRNTLAPFRKGSLIMDNEVIGNEREMQKSSLDLMFLYIILLYFVQINCNKSCIMKYDVIKYGE